jgi:hypothetical protein
MKIKTSLLIGRPLDWAVIACGESITSRVLLEPGGYSPSTKWSQGGPIIEREKIDLIYYGDGGHERGGEWVGAHETEDMEDVEQFGPTPLIAAMRVYVAFKLGDEVEIPEELV